MVITYNYSSKFSCKNITYNNRMINRFYLKGAGKKSRRKSKKKSDITLATQSKGIDHFILIKIIALIRNEKNAPDDKLEFLLQDLAENGIRHDVVHFHLRFNNGETLNKKELIKMLQQGRVRLIEPEIHHILNALDDIVVKVKDIDSKTEIEYLELLYSPQNMAVYFNIEKNFNELEFVLHKLNLGILLQRTELVYLRLFNEELKKLLKIDIEQMVSIDTQRAHKASNRLYRALDKDQKSWHGFPVQQQASFEAAIANEILQDTDSKGELVLSSTLEHYLKRKNMWRDSTFTAAKRAKNRLNIKKLMKPFQDIDEDFPPFVPENITQSISNLYDLTKEMNDFNQLRVQEATIRDDYKKALEVKKESNIQLDQMKEVKDKLAGQLITVITHNGEDLDTLRINNAKKRLEEGEKKVATHEAKEMEIHAEMDKLQAQLDNALDGVAEAKESEKIEYSIDDLKLTDNERDFLEPNYRDELTVNVHERDNWNRSSMSQFRKQRARANAYAKSWENTKYDSRPPITPTNTPPSSSEDEEDESKGWEESKNESTGGAPYALSYYLKGAGKKSKQRKTKTPKPTTMSKEFEHSLLVRIGHDHEEIISFTLQFNNDDEFSDNQLKNILKKGKFSEAETQELLNALNYLKEAFKDIDSKTQIEYIQILYSPINIARITKIKQNISDVEPFVPKNNIKVFEDRVMLEYIKQFKLGLSLDAAAARAGTVAAGIKGSEFEQWLKQENQFKKFVASISENALNKLNIEKLMQPFKDTLNFPTSLPKDIEESILDLHERLKNISDFDEINAIELEWKSKFREHFKLKQETDSNLNTLIEHKDELRGQLVVVTTHNGEDLYTLRMREYNKKNPEMESNPKIDIDEINSQTEKINSQTDKIDSQTEKIKSQTKKERLKQKELRAKQAILIKEAVTLLGNKLPPSLRNENAGKNYRNILNATLRKPDGQDFELDITTQIDSENKQLKSYAVTWAKDEETLQQLVNLLEDFNYVTNNKPIYNDFGEQTLETLYRVYDVIDSPEKYSKRQINNISEDITNIRNALWPNDIELWQTYDNIKKIYNSFRNYLVRNGWSLKPSLFGDTILATTPPNFQLYGSSDGEPFSNTEYKLLMELVYRFSILLPENEILINERRLEMQKQIQIQNEAQQNELDKMVKDTDYMTSILKGILELPSDKNKWAPSKLQKWRILDIHKRLSIDLEKLLEEEKKRVVEKIKLQFGEGQEWVKAVEISAEDMDNFLKIDQFKEKEDEKIKSIISPIIDELLKETTTNSDYLNEIIDEATTEEIQQGDYYDSEDEYEVEPLWKLRNFILDSDESSDGEDIERFFSVKNEGYEEFKNEDTSQKGGSIRDYLDSFSKDEILKAMKQIIKKNSS